VNIIGNSHAGALRRGLALLDDTEQDSFEIIGSAAHFERTAFFKPCPEGVVIIDPDLARRVEWKYGTPVISARTNWGFCFGHLGFLFKVRPWKLYTTTIGVDTQEQGKQLVSTGVVRAYAQNVFAHVLEFLACAALANISFTVILGPPPRRNNLAIINSGAPLEQILLIDRIGRRVLSDKARALGAPVVDAPPESLDADGFLKSELCAPASNGREDNNHANAEYGKLMMCRIATAQSAAAMQGSIGKSVVGN
jgi:hypothetical protein